MRINKLEYIAPTQANPIGSVTFEIEVPTLYKDGETKPVNDSEDARVELSSETQALIQQVAEAIIKDITK